MPNVPFLTYPSFAGVSRYEHSLGVGHLAWWWARRVHLTEDDAEALCLAALYHDAATPALSHLFEEFLRPHGFDHEAELARVVSAESGIPGGRHAQVFLGREPLLRRILAARLDATGRLSINGIVRLARGDDPLGTVVHGDLDLDNIDNVLRAATAMGLVKGTVLHPYQVAAELTWEDEAVQLTSDAGSSISLWQGVRRLLYNAILRSKHEFLAQTALKWAIDEYVDQDPAFLQDPRTWTLTEPELLFEHLRKAPISRELVDRLRLGQVPELLASTWVEDARELLKPGAKDMKRLVEHLRGELGPGIYANFYLDKRERAVSLNRSNRETLFSAQRATDATVGAAVPSAIIGVVGLVRERRNILDTAKRALEAVLGPVGDVSARWLGDQQRFKEPTLL